LIDGNSTITRVLECVAPAGFRFHDAKLRFGRADRSVDLRPGIPHGRSVVGKGQRRAECSWNSALGISLPTLRGASIRQAGTRSRSNWRPSEGKSPHEEAIWN